jgi:P2-related tail formation protein
MNHLDGLISEVKDNGEKYSDEDWKEMDKKVEKVMDECYEQYKDELTKEEKRKILSYATTYVIKRQKKNVEDFKDLVENLELDRRAKEFFQEADEELKDLFNEVLKDDLEEVIDSALDEFEKLAKDLKEAWEDKKDQ